MIKFYKMIFFNSLVLGTLIAISSHSWMGMWMGLEINLLSFIPLMNDTKNMFSTESSIKYFLTQALASVVLLYSIVSLLYLNEFIAPSMNQSLIMILNTSLLTKLGAAPFHFWFPEVMEGLTWMNCVILLTWQKIAPMVLIMNNTSSLMFMGTIIVISIFLSGLMALNQTSLRKIMTFSSINHIGWMLSASMVSQTIWMIYFLVYSFLTILIILIFTSSSSFFVNQLINSFNDDNTLKLFTLSIFLSLGGLPPFLGFLPKWLVINSLIDNHLEILTLMMVIGTLISLYIYLRLIFSTLVLSLSTTKINIYVKKNIGMMALIITSNLLIVITTLILI